MVGDRLGISSLMWSGRLEKFLMLPATTTCLNAAGLLIVRKFIFEETLTMPVAVVRAAIFWTALRVILCIFKIFF
jgi:hypothetical protein